MRFAKQYNEGDNFFKKVLKLSMSGVQRRKLPNYTICKYILTNSIVRKFISVSAMFCLFEPEFSGLDVPV